MVQARGKGNCVFHSYSTALGSLGEIGARGTCVHESMALGVRNTELPSHAASVASSCRYGQRAGLQIGIPWQHARFEVLRQSAPVLARHEVHTVHGPYKFLERQPAIHDSDTGVWPGAQMSTVSLQIEWE